MAAGANAAWAGRLAVAARMAAQPRDREAGFGNLELLICNLPAADIGENATAVQQSEKTEGRACMTHEKAHLFLMSEDSTQIKYSASLAIVHT